MSKQAYRLWTIKDVETYTKKGFSQQEAERIINLAWDEDEDFTSKKEYVKSAKMKADAYSKKIGKLIDWKTMFGEPIESDYRYCSKCDTFFYESDGCECDW